MVSPVDYFSPLQQASQGLNPALALQQGQQVGQGLLTAQQTGLQNQGMRIDIENARVDQGLKQQAIAAAQQQAIASARRKLEFQQKADALAKAGSPAEGIAALMTEYPEVKEQFEKLYETRSTQEKADLAQRAFGYAAALDNGAPDVAKDLLLTDAAAIEAERPREAARLRGLAEVIDKDPNAAKFAINGLLFVNGGDKAIEGKQRVAEGPAALKQKEAEAAEAASQAQIREAEATFAVDKQLADIGYVNAQAKRLATMSALESRRLGLDEKRLALDTKVALAGLLSKQTEMSEKQQAIATDATLAAQAQKQIGEKATKLAETFEKVASSPGRVLTTGPHGQFVEGVSGALGVEGPMTEENQAFERIVAAEIAAMHKQAGGGPMTKADYEVYRGRFPSETSSPTLKAKFLRESAERANRESQIDNARAEFVLENGSLGPAKKDIVVGGMKVPKGATYQNVVGALTVKPAEQAKEKPAFADRVSQLRREGVSKDEARRILAAEGYDVGAGR